MQTQLLTKRAQVDLSDGITIAPLSILPARELQKRSLYFAHLITNGGNHWGEFRLELLSSGTLQHRFRIGFGNTIDTFIGRSPDWDTPYPSETGHYRSEYTGGPAFVVLEQQGPSASRPQPLPATPDAIQFVTGHWESMASNLTWIQYQVHCFPLTWQARIDEIRLTLAKFNTDVVSVPYPRLEIFLGCKSEGADAIQQTYLPGGRKV